MRNRRTGQSGQAIAELVAGLLALCAAFLGMLFVAGLGLSNIENLIKAKSSADLMACKEQASGTSGAQSLIGWNCGSDELYFTADDSPIVGGGEDSSSFVGEMVSSDPAYDLTEPVTIGETSYTSPFSNLELSSFFVNSAGLVSGTESDGDPLDSRGLNDLKGAFEALLGTKPDITLTETVYMPSLYYE